MAIEMYLVRFVHLSDVNLLYFFYHLFQRMILHPFCIFHSRVDEKGYTWPIEMNKQDGGY